MKKLLIILIALITFSCNEREQKCYRQSIIKNGKSRPHYISPNKSVWKGSKNPNQINTLNSIILLGHTDCYTYIDTIERKEYYLIDLVLDSIPCDAKLWITQKDIENNDFYKK